jgi:antitoxin Phd
MDWRLADAKNRFSELFTQVLTLGPQRVRRFKDTVILVSEQDYERITGRRLSFKNFLSQGASLEGPEFATGTEFDRDATK